MKFQIVLSVVTLSLTQLITQSALAFPNGPVATVEQLLRLAQQGDSKQLGTLVTGQAQVALTVPGALNQLALIAAGPKLNVERTLVHHIQWKLHQVRNLDFAFKVTSYPRGVVLDGRLLCRESDREIGTGYMVVDDCFIRELNFR